MAGNFKTPGDDASVLIIGAGFGGMTAGMMLLKQGMKNFRIVDRNEGLGGTWWNNFYPGAEVDVPSTIYSWGFRRFPWSRTHARQAEIVKYCQEVADDEGLNEYITLGTSVTDLIWQDDRKKWHAKLSNGEQFDVDFVISAVGLLNIPSYPNWPGYDDFKGQKVHTAAWDNSVDLTGKRVAVVGVGSSACQVVPTTAPIVKQLYVYQRAPGWILPKFDRDLTEQESQELVTESKWANLKRRWKDFNYINSGMIFGRVYRPATAYAKRSRAFAEGYIAEIFKDRPDLKEAVTPKYAYVGKRLVFSSDYYPALLRDNVTLIPRAVERLTEDGIVDAAGVETKVDVIVMATGYQPLKTVDQINIVGRDGLTLGEAWGDEPRALFGITVPKFPNLFIMYGPSAHGGLIFTNHSSQARWAIKALRAWRKGKRTVEVKPRALQLYVDWLNYVVRNTAWQEVDSYIKNKKGTIITQWPWDAVAYMIMTRLFFRISHKFR